MLDEMFQQKSKCYKMQTPTWSFPFQTIFFYSIIVLYYIYFESDKNLVIINSCHREGHHLILSNTLLL